MTDKGKTTVTDCSLTEIKNWLASEPPSVQRYAGELVAMVEELRTELDEIKEKCKRNANIAGLEVWIESYLQEKAENEQLRARCEAAEKKYHAQVNESGAYLTRQMKVARQEAFRECAEIAEWNAAKYPEDVFERFSDQDVKSATMGRLVSRNIAAAIRESAKAKQPVGCSGQNRKGKGDGPLQIL